MAIDDDKKLQAALVGTWHYQLQKPNSQSTFDVVTVLSANGNYTLNRTLKEAGAAPETHSDQGNWSVSGGRYWRKSNSGHVVECRINSMSDTEFVCTDEKIDAATTQLRVTQGFEIQKAVQCRADAPTISSSRCSSECTRQINQLTLARGVLVFVAARAVLLR